MITERLMGIGSWTVQLRSDTPRPIMEAIDVRRSGFGHIAITPTPIDTWAISDAQILSMVRYLGVYRKQPSEFGMAGGGTALWISDEDGQGRSFVTSLSTTNGTFAEWVSALRPADLLAGITSTISGTLAKTYYRTGLRPPLDDVCAYFGAEWRVTNELKFDIGLPADLFRTTPTSVIVRTKGDGGRDHNVQGIVGNLDVVRDVEDWTRRAVYYTGTAATPEVNSQDGGVADADVIFRGPFGAGAVRDRLVEGFSSPSASGPGYALAMYNQYKTPRQELRLSTDLYDIGQDVRVGDSVYVYDPMRGMQNLDTQITYRGKVIYPETIRCVGLQWPIRAGMGVYFRYYTKPSTTWVVNWLDLTPYVIFESGETQVEVGAKPRTI